MLRLYRRLWPYLLKTDRKDLTADEIWRVYTLLTRAEDAFRDIRPMFHHKEQRTDAHIFLLSVGLPSADRDRKNFARPEHPHLWASLREVLKTHQVCSVVLPTKDGSSLRIRKAATPEPDVQQIYRNLALSPHVITPKHTWTRPPDSD